MNALEHIECELAAAREKRADLDRAIKALEQSADLLKPIYGTRTKADLAFINMSESIKDVGITRAVEHILRSCAGKPLPPTSVRNGLLEAGFELTGENPLASIHQVLKRLVAREKSPYEAVEFQGQTMYKYTPQTLAEQLAVQFMAEQNVPPKKASSASPASPETGKR